MPQPETDALGVPESWLMFTDTLLVFDHVLHTIKVISHARLDGDIDAAYDAAVAKIERLTERLAAPLAALPYTPLDGPTGQPIESNWAHEDYLEAVETTKRYITDGDIIQAVIAQRFSRRTGVHAVELYRSLRVINPSPYMYLLQFGDIAIVGASPELLVKVEDGRVDVHPIAGTRPRTGSPAEDERLAEELRNDPKEIAEHVMLLDLGRNDVGRVSKTGSVEVTQSFDLEFYSHVMHLVSHVQGELREGMSSTTRCDRPSRRAPSPARRRSARWRSSRSWSRTGAAPTPGRSGSSISRQRRDLHHDPHRAAARRRRLRAGRRRHRLRLRPAAGVRGDPAQGAGADGRHRRRRGAGRRQRAVGKPGLLMDAKPLVAAAALRRSDGRVLLVQHASEERSGAGRRWSLPSEPVADDETAEQALARLLNDRLHLTPDRAEFNDSIALPDAIANVFLCSSWSGDPQYAPADFLDAAWAPPGGAAGIDVVEGVRAGCRACPRTGARSRRAPAPRS